MLLVFYVIPGAKVGLEVPFLGGLLARGRWWVHRERGVNTLGETVAGSIMLVKTLVPFPL